MQVRTNNAIWAKQPAAANKEKLAGRAFASSCLYVLEKKT
jgi:hypothetical protein